MFSKMYLAAHTKKNLLLQGMVTVVKNSHLLTINLESSLVQKKSIFHTLQTYKTEANLKFWYFSEILGF